MALLLVLLYLCVNASNNVGWVSVQWELLQFAALKAVADSEVSRITCDITESGLEILLNKSVFLPSSEELNIKALQTHPFLQHFPSAAELSSKVTVCKLSSHTLLQIRLV